MKPVGFHTVILVLVALGPAVASAQWRVVSHAPDGVESPVKVAMVENESGHSLRIYRDLEDRVRGIFVIRDGFDTIAETTCPTYRIDKRTPVKLTFDDEWCQLEPKRAHFTIGFVGDPYTRANGLALFMRGTKILFRYRIEGMGYRETEFTLTGSRHALGLAIGPTAVEFAE